MPIDKSIKSNRLLQSKRYTQQQLGDAQEAFTSVLDINSSEVYAQQNLIPTSSLIYSGSSQNGQYVTASGYNVLKFYYRQRLVPSDTLDTGSYNTWFFLDPTASIDYTNGVNAGVLNTRQQGNFISPKYAPALGGNTEDITPGYQVKLTDSTGTIIDPASYTFDYKDGVLQFNGSSGYSSITTVLTLSAYQYVGKTLGSYTADSSSFDSRLNDITGSFSTTGSLNSFTASMYSFSSSILSATSSLNLATASLYNATSSIYLTTQSLYAHTASMNAYTASNNNTISQLFAETASLRLATASLYTATASLNLFSASINLATASYNTATASLNLFSASINSYTASNNGTISQLYAETASLRTATASLYSTTASLYAFSASMNAFTASQKVLNGTYATTASNVFIGNQTITGSVFITGSETITGNLTVTDTITAQRLIVQTLSSSVIFSSGSNVFGNNLSNTQVFTGSVDITGSLTVNGKNYLNDSSSFSTRTLNLEQTSASVLLATASLYNATASIYLTTQSLYSFSSSMNTYTASNNAVITQLYNETASLKFASASINLATASLYAASASINAFSASINNYTASNNTTISQLYAETASLKAATASLYAASASINSYTASQNILNGTFANTASYNAFSASINSYTSSNNATITQIQNATASLYLTTESLNRATASLNITTASLYNFSASINTYTASVNATISQIQNATASIYTATASLYAASASINTFSASINSFTSSINAYTSSNNTTISQLYAETASLRAATASLNLFSASINSYTASNNNTVSQLFAETASLKAATASLYAASSSFNAFSASVLNYTASQNVLNGKYATTGSNVFIGTQTITGSLLVTGSTVQTGNNTLIGNIVLSGSINISGSQTFTGIGNQVGDSYFTGSVNITGSTTQTGNNTLIGNTLLTGSLTISGSLGVPNPTIKVYGDTEQNGYIKFLPVSTNIDQSVSASYIYVSGSTADLYFSQNGQGYNNTTRLRWLESNLYTGLLSGGIISASLGSTSFTITSGSALIVTMGASTSSIDPYPTARKISWNNISASLINSASAQITYVGIDGNGAIVQQTIPWGSTDTNQYDTQVELGVVLHLSGSKVTGVYNAPQVSYGFAQQTDDFLKAFGPIKISGHAMSPSGSSPTLSLIKTGGTAYNKGANYVNNPNHPSTVVDPAINVSKIYRYYLSGSTPIIDTGVANAGYTTIDNTKYVDTTTGNLATVGNSWSIQRVFWIPNSPTNAFLVYYGNAKYSTLLNAVNAKDSEQFTEAPNTAANAIFLGYIIIQGGNNRDLLDAAETTIIPGGLFRSVGGVASSGTTPVSTTLAGLADVSIPSRTTGDLLYYNGSTWVNSKILTGNYGITGSLTVSAGISSDLTGTASYATNANLLDGLDSTSFVSTGSFGAQTASFNAFSASINNYTASNNTTISQLYAETASLKAVTASLYAASASINAFSASINNYTASQNTLNGTYATTASYNAFSASINNYTSSNNTTISQLFVETASLKAATASLYAASASINAFTSSINSYTSSNNTTISAIYAQTASILAQTASINAFSASINNYTSSNNSAITSLYSATASLNSFSASVLNYTASQNILNGKYATTSSNTFTGVQTINSDLIVTGSITAQTLYVQIVSSSTEFVTGSTRFGTIRSNTHQFTGSVSISGSLAINGVDYETTSASFDNRINLVNGGYVTSASFQAFTASMNSYTSSTNATITQIQNATASLYAASASINAFSASILSYTASQNILNGTYANTASYNAFSSSINLFSASINSYTASQNILNGTYATTASLFAASASINAFTASVNSFTASINAATASYNTATASLYAASASINAFSSSMNAFTASQKVSNGTYATTGSNTFKGTETISGSLLISGSGTILSLNTDTLEVTGSLIVAGTSSLSGLSSITGSLGISGSTTITGSITVSGSVVNSLTASYAITASYAMNGGSGGGSSVLYILDEGSTQGSASYLDFVGAGVTATVSNGTASINIPGGAGSSQAGGNSVLTQSAANVTWSFTHNLNTQFPVFTIFDSNNDVIIPQRINAVNTSSALIYFSTPRAGYAVASQGGNVTTASYALVAVSASFASTSSFVKNAQTASYVVLANSASYVTLAQTASYWSGSITNAATASYVVLAQTASYWSGSTSNAVSSSYAATSSYSNAFTVAGTITAQTLIVQTITASQEYSSGSNVFGNSLANTQILTGSVTITGSLAVNGSNVILNNQTSSMSVATASFVTLAQTASFITTAQTASFVRNAQSASYWSGSITNAISSSFASTASYVGGAVTNVAVNAPYYDTIQFTYGNGSQTNLTINNVASSSFATTASFASTASFVKNAQTASFVTTAQTASFVQTAQTASYVVTAQTASYWSGSITNATSASFALTASYAMNGGGGGISAISVADESILQGSASYFDFMGAGVTATVSGGTASFTITGGGTITGSNIIYNQSAAATTWSFSHNLNNQFPIFQIFNSNNEVVIPEKIIAATTSSALIYFPVPVSGKAVASVGGMSGSGASGGSGAGFPFSGSAVITGSLLVSGAFADFTRVANFTGSLTGSLLGTASYAMNSPGYTVQFTQSSAATTWSFTHNMNTRNPIVQVYDSSYKQILPNDIVGINGSTAEIRFDYAQSGYAIMSNGGGLYVTGSTSTLVQSSAAVTWSFTHNLNSKYPNFEVYDNSDYVIIPAGVKAIDNNNAELYFSTTQAGRAIANFSGINGAPNATSASYAVTSSYASTLVLNQSLMSYASVNSSIVGSNNLFTQTTGSYTAAFFKYTAASGSNARAGQVSAVWNGGTVEFMDVSTNDIGNTNVVTSSISLVGTDVQFNMQTNTSGWRIKSTATFI